METYLEDAGVDLSQINQGIKDQENLPVHGAPFRFPDSFYEALEANKRAALQPGVHSKDAPDVEDVAGLLCDMPEALAERRRTLSRKPATYENEDGLHNELLKRMQVPDLKFFLTKLEKSTTGNKASLLRRFLLAKSESPDNLMPAMQLLANLYYIHPPARPSSDTPDEEDDPAMPGLTEPRRTQEPRHAYAPVGEEAIAAEMDVVIEGINSRSQDQMVSDPKLVYLYKDRETGELMVEMFIDLLEVDRSKLQLGGNFSVRFPANPQPYDVCPHGVHKGSTTCKCHLPVIQVGQDECIFKSYALSNRVWTLGHDEGKKIQGMRKKGDGIGWIDDIRVPGRGNWVWVAHVAG